MTLKNRSLMYKTSGPEETAALARKIAMLVRPGDVILLKGDLGAGKSIFARAFIQALCGEDTEVPSPTFTLVQTYEAPPFLVWHFDLYRLTHEADVDELGIDEAYAGGVSLIEWPERLGTDHLPLHALEIDFQYGSHGNENERILRLSGWDGRRWEEIGRLLGVDC